MRHNRQGKSTIDFPFRKFSQTLESMQRKSFSSKLLRTVYISFGMLEATHKLHTEEHKRCHQLIVSGLCYSEIQILSYLCGKYLTQELKKISKFWVYSSKGLVYYNDFKYEVML